MGQEAPRGPSRTILISPVGALCFLAGMIVIQLLPALPPRALSFTLLLGALAAIWRWPHCRGIALAVLGAAWVMLRADFALDARLPREFEGRDIDVVGVVENLPHAGEGSLRFELRPLSALLDGMPVDLRGSLRVAWYRDSAMLAPCERWQLRLRLKRPRGLVNPGGFDTERQALERGIAANGYVRDDGDNRRIAPASFCVDGLRAQLSNTIATRLGDTTPVRLLRALAVGDQRDLDEHDWQVLRATGVGHLIAISGFHVGLFAGLGALVMRGFWKLWPRLTRRIPGVLLEAPAGFAFATGYAALAGFGLPTTRTLLMIAIVALARLRRRVLAPSQALAFALVAILVADPIAVLSVGFWLSFVGVAFLLFCLGSGHAHGWRPLVAAQGAMSVGLLPLSIWFFGASSVVGPLANLVAVPLVSLVIVPLALAGCIMLPFATGLLDLAVWILRGQWWLLEQLAALPGAQWFLPEPGTAVFAIALVGVIVLLLPRGVSARWLGACLLLPLLCPANSAPPEGTVEAVVLDVGQGLSVLVRTRDHALVYDTGPRYPSGFDLGEAVVVPAARALGFNRIDRLIVSHGDNDHAGGAETVAHALTPMRINSGEPDRLRLSSQPCSDERWRWNGVIFHLFRARHPASDNDRSCVLVIDAGQARLVVPGDISAAVEREVADAAGSIAASAASILVVPHHGSRSSSSEGFLDTLGPRLALVSAGYRSRFGHPHPVVVARYARRSIPLVNTADAGCLHWRSDVPGEVERCRDARRRYWREP